MRNFYLSYPICQIVSSKLSWSHYERLSLSARNKNKDLHHPEYTKRAPHAPEQTYRRISLRRSVWCSFSVQLQPRQSLGGTASAFIHF